MEGMKMKYKAGDRVLIKDSLEGTKRNPKGMMDKWCGKVITIKKIDNDLWPSYHMEENRWNWYDDMIERKVEEEKMFTKDDLKTGMVVEMRGYGKFLVVLGTPLGDYLINDKEQQNLSSYGNDLKILGSSGCEITAVYEPVRDYTMRFGRWGEMKLIWERKEKPIEITIEEIAKLKGVSPDRIRIKE
jgi:hypothetical protein